MNARRIDGEGQSTKRTAGMTERNERANEREAAGLCYLQRGAARCGAETDAAARRIEREKENEMGEDQKR